MAIIEKWLKWRANLQPAENFIFSYHRTSYMNTLSGIFLQEAHV